MSGTYRGLNRTLLTLLGLVLVAAGAVVASLALWSAAAQLWTQLLSQGRELVSSALANTRINGTGLSWIWLALLALALLGVVFLLLWIGSQGGGRRATLRKVQAAEGTVTLQEEIAATSLKAALADDPRVLHTSVSGWQLPEGVGVKISLQARKGASPRQLADSVEQLVTGLDRLLGSRLAVLISINSGARTAWSHEHRVH